MKIINPKIQYIMKHFTQATANGLCTPPCGSSHGKSTRFFFLTLLLGLLTLGSTLAWANDYELHNPIGADGYYIVKWDCANNTWASSNDMEVDETFTFAIDITGNDYLLNSVANKANPFIAFRKYIGNDYSDGGVYNDNTNRLTRITGNIFGATYNFKLMDSGKTPAKIWAEFWNASDTWDWNGRKRITSPDKDGLFKFATSTDRDDPCGSVDWTEGSTFDGWWADDNSHKGYTDPCIFSSAGSGEEPAERTISTDYRLRGDLWPYQDDGAWAGKDHHPELTPKPYKESDGTYTFSYIAPVANNNRFTVMVGNGSDISASTADGTSGDVSTNSVKYIFNVSSSPKRVNITYYPSTTKAKVVLSNYTPVTSGWYFKCEKAIGGIAANTNTAMASDGTLILRNVAADTYYFYIHDNASELYWGFNKFGGCYVDQSYSTSSLIPTLTADAKFSSKQWPIKNVSDRKVMMVVSADDAGKDIRVSFDGGKITINTLSRQNISGTTYCLTGIFNSWNNSNRAMTWSNDTKAHTYTLSNVTSDYSKNEHGWKAFKIVPSGSWENQIHGTSATIIVNGVVVPYNSDNECTTCGYNTVADNRILVQVDEASDITFNYYQYTGGINIVDITRTAYVAPVNTYTVTIHPNPNNVNDVTVRNNVPEGSGTSASELNLSAFIYGAGTATWYTNEACTTPFSTVTSDMHLYAKWGVDGEYYLVGDLQTASDAITTGNWSNDLGRKLEYPGNATSGVCSFSFVAPKGKTVFEIIKDKNWSRKLNGGSYAAVLDNTNSDVTLSVEGDHISFTLDAPKLVTVSLDGKVKVTTADVAFDNSPTWRVKTSNTGWGADGNNWDWNTIMTNNGTTNATAILRNVPAGAHRFIISTETSDGEAYKYVGNNTFHALYVDTSNPSAGLTWNTNTVKLAGDVQVSGIPHETNDNYERRCKFTLANDANAINGKYDLLITFDGGSIRCDVQPKRTVTFKDGATTLSTVQVFDGGNVTAAVHNKSGYDFVKWHEYGSNTQFDFANTAITGNLDLYGEWVYKHISSVSLNESTHSTWVGNSDFTLTLTKDPEDLNAKSVVWSSNNTSVATVSDGTVHVEAGVGITEETVVRITCTVTDQYDVSRSAYCDVTVAPCQMTTDNLYSMNVTGYNSSTGNSATLTGLWNESSDNTEPATFRIVKLKLSDNNYIYDDNGTVKMSTNASLATAQWYEIPIGENFSPDWTGSSFALYEFKNVSTGKYMRRSDVSGGGGDWRYYTTITDNRPEDGTKYQFFYDNTHSKHLVCRANSNSSLQASYCLHRCNSYMDGDNYNNCPMPNVPCGTFTDPDGNAHTKLHETVVVDPSYSNPNYKASQMNSAYYRMKADATVRANLANGLAYGSVITVRLYADAATTVQLTKADGTEIETIDLSADAALDYTYTVNTASLLLGESAFIIKAADNHAAIASISVSRTHAVEPNDPALAWDDVDLETTGITQSALGGNIVHTAASVAGSTGAISYTSSNTAVADIEADGTVLPHMAGSTIITATIEEAGCYGEASITYTITLTEPTLAERIAADAGEGITLTHDYAENIVIDKALTINGNDHTIGNLTVENSGDLTLSGNLTVNDFSIYAKAGNTTTPAASGQVRNATNLTVNGEAYFLYTVDPSGHVQYGWYDFTVPFRVNVMTGIAGIDGSGLNENFVNERDYAIMEFLGDKKAAGQYAYKKFRGIMQPGILYSITLDDEYNYNTIRFKKTDGALAPIASVDLPGHSGEIATKENWNGVGNGSLHHINIGGVSPEVIQVYQSGDKSFLPVDPSSCSFAVGVAFMIQGTGTMTFPQASNNLLAPRRAASAPQRTAIQIAGEGKPFSDQLFISADEMAGQAYTQGVDVAKAGDLGSAKVAQLWTNAYNTPLCAHEAQLINGEAQYALSIYAPANGSYTLTSQNIPDGATLYLTQNGNRIWDLSEAYTLDLTKGTNTEYSLLLVESHKIPTGVDAINSNADTKKIMHNGILYILRNGKVFNAQGAVMK